MNRKEKLNGKYPFFCQLCDPVVISSYQSSRHQFTLHSNESYIYSCIANCDSKTDQHAFMYRIFLFHFSSSQAKDLFSNFVAVSLLFLTVRFYLSFSFLCNFISLHDSYNKYVYNQEFLLEYNFHTIYDFNRVQFIIYHSLICDTLNVNVMTIVLIIILIFIH